MKGVNFHCDTEANGETRGEIYELFTPEYICQPRNSEGENKGKRMGYSNAIKQTEPREKAGRNVFSSSFFLAKLAVIASAGEEVELR